MGKNEYRGDAGAYRLYIEVYRNLKVKSTLKCQSHYIAYSPNKLLYPSCKPQEGLFHVMSYFPTGAV